MRSLSFTAVSLVVCVGSGSCGITGRAGAASAPAVTPALGVREYEGAIKRRDDDPDA